MSTVVIAVAGSGSGVRRDGVRHENGVRQSARPGTARLRLTRRGRVVLAVAGLLMAGGVGSIMTQAAADPAVDAGATTTVVVAPGESLWTLAEEIAAPEDDVRDVVAAIADLNDLDGLALLAGQELLLPAS